MDQKSRLSHFFFFQDCIEQDHILFAVQWQHPNSVNECAYFSMHLACHELLNISYLIALELEASDFNEWMLRFWANKGINELPYIMHRRTRYNTPDGYWLCQQQLTECIGEKNNSVYWVSGRVDVAAVYGEFGSAGGLSAVGLVPVYSSWKVNKQLFFNGFLEGWK
jgi:hypothetical protein